MLLIGRSLIVLEIIAHLHQDTGIESVYLSRHEVLGWLRIS